MEETAILEAVTERDIDLLLLEEIHASEFFRKWLASTIVGADAAGFSFVNAWHSILDPSLGESDMLVIFSNRALGKEAILLENKIDAPAQPDQAKRYTERGKLGVQRGAWCAFKTAILAPDRYLSRSADVGTYDSMVSYEAIRDWFQSNCLESERSAYRARVIQLAIDQNKRGYNPRIDERVSKFFFAYWELASREFPELAMEKPGDKPAGSNWIGFHPKGSGKRRWIWHKMDVGHVDLELKGAAGKLDEFRDKYSQLFPHDTDIVKAGKSAAVRIRVPILNILGDFDEQIDKARGGMRAAYRLLYQSRAIGGA